MLQKLVNAYRIFRRWLYLAILFAFWAPLVIWPYLARDFGIPMMILSALAWLAALRILFTPYFYNGLGEAVQLYEKRTGKTIN